MRQHSQWVLAAAIGAMTSATFAGTFTTITIDGEMADWASVPVLVTDASGDGNPIDVGAVQMANDADNLYLRISYVTPVNPNLGPSIYLAFDVDSNLATGFNIYGLNVVGSDAAFQNDFPFDQRGGFNSGGLTAAANLSPVDWGDPSHLFSSQEYSIPRSIAFASDMVPVFGNPGFNLMLWTDSGIAADTTSAIPYVFAAPVTGWAIDASGDWNDAANWTYGSSPNAIDALAELGGKITAAQTVFSNSAVTVGTLKFDNANQYVIGGTGSLTLDVSTGNAIVDVAQGSHKINLPLTLADNSDATVAAGATLTIGDPLSLGTRTLNKAGAGTLEVISTVSSTAGTFHVTAGTANLRTNLGTGTTLTSDGGATNLFATNRVAVVNVAGGTVKIDSAGAAKVLKTGTLTTTGSGKLDLTDNGLIVTSGSIATVKAAIISGYAAGAWNGNGIISSSADSRYAVGYALASQVGSPATFMGEAVTGTSVLARLTLRGDNNLDANVNFDDLLSLAQAYNLSGQSWVNGDNNYDGNVNFDDLLALAQNYGLSALSSSQVSQLDAVAGSDFAHDWTLALALAPEPTSLSVIAGAMGLCSRRRRTV